MGTEGKGGGTHLLRQAANNGGLPQLVREGCMGSGNVVG